MKNYTILIADDQIEKLHIIEDTLLESGMTHKLIMVTNGKQLIDFAEKRIPDLIITDWEMPEMDGIKAIRVLKKNKQTQDIPIIMCTGKMTSSENLRTALTSGAIDYVRHPIDKIELQARVLSMLKLSDSYKTIKEQNTLLIQKKEEIQKQQALIIKQETDQIKNQLEIKKCELKNTKLRLINYNLSVSKFVSNIKTLNPYINKEGAKIAKAIISNYLIEDKERNCEEIEIRFKEANITFCEKLEHLYPTLSQKEKRICLFIYLKMDTNEISKMLNQSIRTIEGIRTAIRKKMNLNKSSENLYTFISELDKGNEK